MSLNTGTWLYTSLESQTADSQTTTRQSRQQILVQTDGTTQANLISDTGLLLLTDRKTEKPAEPDPALLSPTMLSPT